MNSSAQVAIALLGVYFVVSGIGALSILPDSLAAFDRESLRFVWVANPGGKLAIALVTILLLRIAPGAVLIKYHALVAQRILPQTERSTDIVRPAEFYVIGCLLLALYFGVDGLTSAIASAASVVAWTSTEYFFATGFGRLAGAFVELVASAVLFRHAKARGALLARNPIADTIDVREQTCSFCEHRFTSLQPAWKQFLKTGRCPKCAQQLDL